MRIIDRNKVTIRALWLVRNIKFESKKQCINCPEKIKTLISVAALSVRKVAKSDL